METYIVKPGDTLSGIARRFGVALTDLLRAHRQISNPNRIFAGQRLNIPGEEPRTDQSEAMSSPVSSPTTTSDFARLTVQQLITIVPTLSQAKASSLIDAIHQALQEANITTPLQEARCGPCRPRSLERRTSCHYCSTSSATPSASSMTAGIRPSRI